MNPRRTTAALTALAIALWAAGALAATFTSPPDVPPLSRPNMVVLVLSSSMLLALLTSCQIRTHANGHAASPQTQGPLSSRSLALVLLSGAAITAMALMLTMPDAPARASTPWLASVYAAAAITLTTAVRLVLESAPPPPSN